MFNKIGKIALLLFVSWFAYAAITTTSDPEFVWMAKNDLRIGYEENIQNHPLCRAKQIENHWFVYCSDPGGLFEVKDQGNDEYRLYALNGRSSTHADRMGTPVAYSELNISQDYIVKTFEDD
jgi:hypothetical protein